MTPDTDNQPILERNIRSFFFILKFEVFSARILCYHEWTDTYKYRKWRNFSMSNLNYTRTGNMILVSIMLMSMPGKHELPIQ